MTINAQNQKILVLLILAGIIIAGVMFFIFPKITKINSLAKEISESISNVKSLELARHQISFLNIKKDEYKNELGDQGIREILLSREEEKYNDFINSLYDLAEKDNLQAKITYSNNNKPNDENKDGLGYVLINLELTGGYFESYNFLKKIENYPILIDILEYKISKEKDLNVLSKFLLKVYANPSN